MSSQDLEVKLLFWASSYFEVNSKGLRQLTERMARRLGGTNIYIYIYIYVCIFIYAIHIYIYIVYT